MDNLTIAKFKQTIKLEYANLKMTLYQKPKDYILGNAELLHYFNTWFSFMQLDIFEMNMYLEQGGIDEDWLNDMLYRDDGHLIQRAFSDYKDYSRIVAFNYEGIVHTLRSYQDSIFEAEAEDV